LKISRPNPLSPTLWSATGSELSSVTVERMEIPKAVAEAYAQLEQGVRTIVHTDRVSYAAPVNFTESMKTPRHRWFPYKEGFSPSFVRSFSDIHTGSRLGRTLDPFAGVGTTALEASLCGGDGVGIEVSPMAAFVARTKGIQLSSRQLTRFRALIGQYERCRKLRPCSFSNNATVTSYFEAPYLDALMSVRGFAEQLDDETLADLFRLSFLSEIEPFSTHRKAGNGQKRKTRLLYRDLPGSPLEQVREAIVTRLRMYADDIERTPRTGTMLIEQGTSLGAVRSMDEASIDGVLTSPPYANCFDYSKIYLCELWLGGFFKSIDDQRAFRESSMRSHVHARWVARHDDFGSRVVDDVIAPLLDRADLWSKQIPEMLRGYFRDLGKLLHDLYPIIKPHAPIGIVVSNSSYGGIPIATDLLVGEVARSCGYTIECIEVYRYMIPSSQQFMQVRDRSLFRESMVVCRKPQ
jgi:hypothetical protein